MAPTSPRSFESLAIVGPGRLGRSLAALLASRGVTPQLVGRGDAIPRAEVLLLTVPDRAVGPLAASLSPGPVVLHCSGALDVEVLRPCRPAGSWHPLMTFPGPEIALPVLHGVPAAVAGDPEAVAVATQLAEVLGMTPLLVPGDRRLYHAAAVMAGNLATVLLAEAARALTAAGVAPADARAALLPLARTSLENAAIDPRRALTGPVARGDASTLVKHRAALREAGLHDLVLWVDLLEERGGRLLADEDVPR